jgi:hypothetical protein
MTDLPDSFTRTCDPGHGWLLVKAGDIAALGLTEADFTPYSYQAPRFSHDFAGVIALEEDCDAGTFIEAYKARVGQVPRIVTDEKGGRVRAWPGYGSKPSRW